MSRQKSGADLEFISQIKRNGSGTEPIEPDYLEMLQKEKFSLTCLSLTEGTYIASGFNSFVVKMKKKIIMPDRIRIHVFSSLPLESNGSSSQYDFNKGGVWQNYEDAIKFLQEEQAKLEK